MSVTEEKGASDGVPSSRLSEENPTLKLQDVLIFKNNPKLLEYYRAKIQKVLTSEKFKQAKARWAKEMVDARVGKVRSGKSEE